MSLTKENRKYYIGAEDEPVPEFNQESGEAGGSIATLWTKCISDFKMFTVAAGTTALGWTFTSSGQGDYNNMFFAKCNMRDFDQMCSLDVLRITDRPAQCVLLEDFKGQLQRSPEGWYRTCLLWKKDIPELPNNEQGSITSKARAKAREKGSTVRQV